MLFRSRADANRAQANPSPGTGFNDAFTFARSQCRSTAGGCIPALGSAHRLLTRPVPHGSGAIEIGLSVGAALLKPSHRDDPKRLFAEADSALYVARAAGSNCVRVFDGMIARPTVAARTGTVSLSPSRS